MKKLTSLLLSLIIMLLAFAGCNKWDFSADFLDFRINYFPESSNTSNLEEATTSSFSNFSYGDSSYYNYDEQNSNYPQTPTFYTLEDIRDYLNSQKDKNFFKNSFYYKGTKELTGEMLAQMVSCFYIEYYESHKKSGLYTVTIWEFPGDRIIDAYFSNDAFLLTADEKKALDKATQMVSDAKAKAKDEWELELLLYDMLIENTAYYHKEYEFNSYDDAPRFLTAVGALLDGKANCQGYTDAFYVLASIGGFRVGRMCVEAPSDLHMLNTILLNGSWYVVDATFGDEEGAPTDYRLFNAGMDQINDITWASYKEIHKIAAVSNSYSYYIRKGLVFNSITDFTKDIKDRWTAGEKIMRGVLKNQTDGEVLKAALDKTLMDADLEFSYRFWYYDDGKDTYYTVSFEKI